MQTSFSTETSFTKNILIIAGEASGDQHAAKLIRETQGLNANVHFFGIGGKAMRAAGAEIVIDSAQLAVVGAIEVLMHFKAIYLAWKKMSALLQQRRPDLVILVDYPGFNLRFAKVAKQNNIKVLYYISPQIWAWKRKRIDVIRQYVDKMLVILPFETEIYQQAHVPVEFVGHPLVDEVQPSMTKAKAFEYFKIDPRQRVIGLLPGSRKGEINYLLPTLLAAAQQIKQRYPQTSFLLPLASTLSRQDLAPYLSQIDFEVKVIDEDFLNVVQLCDAAIVTSGTATLQVALMQIPMVIVYKVNALTYAIAKKIVKLDYIGLCNIVAKEAIVKELIQAAANPSAIAAEIIRILDDETYRRQMIANLTAVKLKLGKSEQPMQAARATLTMLSLDEQP